MRKNDLELQAIRQCPKIKLTLELLKNKTKPLMTRMTGSGATCFALYEDQENLNNAEIVIKKKFKGFWTTKTRITNSI